VKKRDLIRILPGVFLCACLWAQTRETCSLRGIVQELPGQPDRAATVELSDLPRQRPPDEAKVNMDDTFEIHKLPCGTYSLRVQDAAGRVLRQDFVVVRPEDIPITIRLNTSGASSPGSGTVSVARLLKPVPKKALRGMAHAEKLSRSGQYTKAAAELERAVQIAPDYGEAHGNLGVQYMRLGQPRKALAEIRKAIELGPPAAMEYGNLSFAYWSLGRNTEAEAAARQALHLDGSYRQAHYLLGVLLMADQRRSREAAQHLQEAAEAIPRARLNLAQVYARRGEPQKAVAELKAYREMAPAGFRKQVDLWISELQGSQ